MKILISSIFFEAFISSKDHSLLFLFLFLLTQFIFNLSFCWLLGLHLLQLSHAHDLFLFYFLSSWIHHWCSCLWNLSLLYFACCLLYCKLVLYFFTRFLCCFTLLNKFIRKPICCRSCQFFYVINTIVFSSQHWSIHTFRGNSNLFSSKYQIITTNKFFITFKSEINKKIHSFDVNNCHSIVNQSNF